MPLRCGEVFTCVHSLKPQKAWALILGLFSYMGLWIFTGIFSHCVVHVSNMCLYFITSNYWPFSYEMVSKREFISAGVYTDVVIGWVVSEASAPRAYWCASSTNCWSRRQSCSTWNVHIDYFYIWIYNIFKIHCD